MHIMTFFAYMKCEVWTLDIMTWKICFYILGFMHYEIGWKEIKGWIESIARTISTELTSGVFHWSFGVCNVVCGYLLCL